MSHILLAVLWAQAPSGAYRAPYDFRPIFVDVDLDVLVLQPEIEPVLKLSGQQKSQLALLAVARKKLVEKVGALLLSEKDDKEKVLQITKELDDPLLSRKGARIAVEEILDESQRKRLGEIRNQFLGAARPFQPAEQAAFGLTDGQRVRFLEREKELAAIRSTARRALTDRDEPQRTDKLKAAKTDLDDRLTALLTTAQRQKLEAENGEKAGLDELRTRLATRRVEPAERQFIPIHRHHHSMARLLDSRVVRDYLDVRPKQWENIGSVAHEHAKLQVLLSRIYSELPNEYRFIFWSYAGSDRRRPGFERQVFDCLDNKQKTRLENIRLRAFGPAEITSTMRNELGITKAQNAQIIELWGLLPKIDTSGDPALFVQSGQRRVQALQAGTLAILTPAQRKVWDAALGDPVPEAVLQAARDICTNANREPDP